MLLLSQWVGVFSPYRLKLRLFKQTNINKISSWMGKKFQTVQVPTSKIHILVTRICRLVIYLHFY